MYLFIYIYWYGCRIVIVLLEQVYPLTALAKQSLLVIATTNVDKKRNSWLPLPYDRKRHSPFLAYWGQYMGEWLYWIDENEVLNISTCLRDRTMQPLASFAVFAAVCISLASAFPFYDGPTQCSSYVYFYFTFLPLIFSRFILQLLFAVSRGNRTLFQRCEHSTLHSRDPCLGNRLSLPRCPQYVPRVCWITFRFHWLNTRRQLPTVCLDVSSKQQHPTLLAK